MQVYKVRKLRFQANLCEAFAEKKQQHYCGDLVLGWAIFQKTDFNHQERGFPSKLERSIDLAIYCPIAQNLT